MNTKRRKQSKVCLPSVVPAFADLPAPAEAGFAKAGALCADRPEAIMEPRTKNEEQRTGGLPAAFTLVELLVVIVVIAILAGITIPVSKYAIARAKAARQEVMLAKIRSALDDYRAAYGEYPITPLTNGVCDQAETIKHYWDNLIPDLDTVSNSPLPNVNLSTNTIEYAVVDGQTYKVDYGLTFPLMLRQEREGKRPFMQFDKVTILYNVYRFAEAGGGEVKYQGKRRTKSGSLENAEILYARGRPIDRAKAIDPVSGKQWKYECYDGITYTITTNTFY